MNIKINKWHNFLLNKNVLIHMALGRKQILQKYRFKNNFIMEIEFNTINSCISEVKLGISVA